MHIESEFATVGSYRTAIEAYAAKHFLETRGIRVFVLDEHTSTLGWWNDLDVKIRVPIALADQARELLAAKK